MDEAPDEAEAMGLNLCFGIVSIVYANGFLGTLKISVIVGKLNTVHVNIISRVYLSELYDRRLKSQAVGANRTSRDSVLSDWDFPTHTVSNLAM